MDSWPLIPRASDTYNGYGMRECDAQPATLDAPSWKILDSYLCGIDISVLHTKIAGRTHGR